MEAILPALSDLFTQIFSQLSPWMTAFLWGMVFLAGFVDAAAGGGGLIALPAYLFAGLPVHVAYGCNKVSSAIGTTFSAARYFKSGAVELKTGLIAAAASFAGSAVGTRLMLHMSETAARVMLAVLLPLAAVFLLWQRKLPDEDRSARLSLGRRLLLAAVVGLLCGVYDGLIGPGTGTFAILAFTALIGFDLRRAGGNAKLMNLASNYASVIAIVGAGSVNYFVALPAALFGIAGHLLGSAAALKGGARFIRPMMLVVLLLLLGDLVYELVA